MKIYRDLLKAASLHKQVNNVRYMLALRQIGRGDGSVPFDVAQVELSKIFGVKPKTVKNRLYICIQAGFGNLNPDGTRLYYYSQARMLAAMGEELTSKVSVNLENFGRNVVEGRAKFHAAVLAAHGPDLTITRQTISNWTGRAKRTQRQYEALANIAVSSNFARLFEYSGNKYDLDRVRYLGHAAFIMQFNGKAFITKQLANSYSVNGIVKGTRKVNQPCIIVGGGNDGKTRVYFSKLKDGMNEWAKKGKTCDAYVRNGDVWEWLLGEPKVF